MSTNTYTTTNESMLEDVDSAVRVGKERGGIDLNAWEEEFIEHVRWRLDHGQELTTKQGETLERIWDRI